MNQLQCEICGKKDALVFHCNYCGGYFCAEHHLPESHNCSHKPHNPPSYIQPSDTSLPPELKYGYDYPNPKPPKPRHKKKIIWGLIAVLLIVSLLGYAYYSKQLPFQSSSSLNTSKPSTSSSSPTTNPNNIPTSTTPYVEVDYRIVGWFYSESLGSAYNYTYLVLNVTITNHGYSQVNVFGDLGFSVLINNFEYSPPTYGSYFSCYNSSGTYYVDYPWTGTTAECFNLGSSLPSPAKLLDTGSVAGIVVFKLGDPDVYPPQPQILNEPFTLKYSVTYGKDGFILTGPYAEVKFSQIG